MTLFPGMIWSSLLFSLENLSLLLLWGFSWESWGFGKSRTRYADWISYRFLCLCLAQISIWNRNSESRINTMPGTFDAENWFESEWAWNDKRKIIFWSCIRLASGEVASIQEDGNAKSGCEVETASEDERRRVRPRSLKKKAMSASTRLSQTLRKRGNRVADCRFASISIHDVRDAKEEEAVNAFRDTLLAKDLLPPRHDDYHTLLR